MFRSQTLIRSVAMLPAAALWLSCQTAVALAQDPPNSEALRAGASHPRGQADVRFLGRQIQPRIRCDLPDRVSVVVHVRVSLDAQGRLVRQPRLINPGTGEAYTATADSVVTAIIAAEPFDVPPGFEEQDVIFAFNTAAVCQS